MALDNAHDILDDLLALPELEEDALDYMGALGALAAFAITPKQISTAQIVAHILDDAASSVSPEHTQQLSAAIEQISHELRIQFEGEEDFALPWMEDEDDEDALISWSAGFVEVVFAFEALWLNHQFEEEATQLLMPIFTLSGILEEETEEITMDEQLISQWIEEIPEILVDLFLMFRVTEDKKDNKKAPPKNVYGASKAKKGSGNNKSGSSKRGGRGQSGKKAR